MDYETFTNNTTGIGGWGRLVIAIFWLAVAILSTVALNIIIAIVGSAYEEAKDKEGPVEVGNFLVRLHLRLRLLCISFLRHPLFGYVTTQLQALWTHTFPSAPSYPAVHVCLSCMAETDLDLHLCKTHIFLPMDRGAACTLLVGV
jgi:hypothetical protein